MELKEFVYTTIKEISGGINQASVELGKEIQLSFGKDGAGHVEFDVAVVAETNSSTEGNVNAGVTVAGINLLGGKIQGNIGEKNSNLSHIKFAIWIKQ